MVNQFLALFVAFRTDITPFFNKVNVVSRQSSSNFVFVLSKNIYANRSCLLLCIWLAFEFLLAARNNGRTQEESHRYDHMKCDTLSVSSCTIASVNRFAAYQVECYLYD